MNKLAIISLVVGSAWAGAASANSAFFTPGNVSGSLSTGILGGESKERVYAPDEGGRKVSQLNWKYKNAPVIKGELAWNLMPWVSLNASGWTTLASRGASMTDYDWEYKNQQHWSDRSRHPDTRLTYANQFDLGLTGWLLNQPEYRLGIVAGYLQSRFSWSSHGGYYNYDNGTQVGEFGPGRSIGYRQTFKLPYIGITGMYRYQNWELGSTFKFSNWGSARDNDEHYLNMASYHTKVKDQRYYSLAADVGYYLSENAKVFVEGSWTRYENRKGNLYMIDYSNGDMGYVPNGGGIEHSSYMVTAGLKYTF